MPVSTLSLPGALEREPVMPWAQVELDPDEAIFEDEEEAEDWDDLDDLDDLDAPDELEFGDDDWEDEFDGYIAPDEDSEEAVGW
ncbi:MAG: hypothetical protein M8866_07920 [marine benthic group bacterium]|nr:hypothetical protein [Candidatus Benthicola marisminoris]